MLMLAGKLQAPTLDEGFHRVRAIR